MSKVKKYGISPILKAFKVWKGIYIYLKVREEAEKRKISDNEEIAYQDIKKCPYCKILIKVSFNSECEKGLMFNVDEHWENRCHPMPKRERCTPPLQKIKKGM